MDIQIFGLNGKKVATETAFSAWDNKVVSPKLLHQVYVNFESNKRIARAHTKDRSERSGGGIKPWRQKGTGRARAGSSRSPIWRKGGVTFGPRSSRNYITHTPSSMRRTALAGVIIGKIKDEEMVVLQEMPEVSGKTKEFKTAIDKLSLKGTTIFLVAGDKAVRAPFARAGRNLPGIFVKNPATVTANDLLRVSMVVTDKTGLHALEERVTTK